MPPHSIVEMGISHVPEGRRIFPKLTVKENLEMGARIQKVQSSKFKIQNLKFNWRRSMRCFLS